MNNLRFALIVSGNWGDFVFHYSWILVIWTFDTIILSAIYAMWNHSVLLLMLCNFCRHFVFLLVCRHLQSVTLWNWEVSPEVTGKLPSLSSSIRSSQRLCAPVFTRTEKWEASMTFHCLSFALCCTTLVDRCGVAMLHPLTSTQCCASGAARRASRLWHSATSLGPGYFILSH